MMPATRVIVTEVSQFALGSAIAGFGAPLRFAGYAAAPMRPRLPIRAAGAKLAAQADLAQVRHTLEGMAIGRDVPQGRAVLAGDRPALQAVGDDDGGGDRVLEEHAGAIPVERHDIEMGANGRTGTPA